MKKIITVVIPTYNEQENVYCIYQRIVDVFSSELNEYELEIMFIDNYSTDSTREMIAELAEKDKRVRAIFNAKNFGFSRSTFYGLTQAMGDCAILIFADMQDPPELIPKFVHQWCNGYKIVIGIKNSSEENKIIYLLRKCYYSVLKKISEVDHIKQFDGFGLYDRSFIEVLKKLDDPLPYLRGIVAELGPRRADIPYRQEKRRFGKSHFNFFKLYDLAMLGITSYSKIVMRIATFLGFALAVISFLIATGTFIYKIFNWESFPVGNAAISIGVFFFGAVQLFFVGLLGEYILNINTRVLHRPLVIEERRINFDIDEKDT